MKGYPVIINRNRMVQRDSVALRDAPFNYVKKAMPYKHSTFKPCRAGFCGVIAKMEIPKMQLVVPLQADMLLGKFNAVWPFTLTGGEG